MRRIEWAKGARVEYWIAGTTGSLFGLLATACLVAGHTLFAAELGLVAAILGVTASASRREEDRVRFQPRALALLEERPIARINRTRVRAPRE